MKKSSDNYDLKEAILHNQKLLAKLDLKLANQKLDKLTSKTNQVMLKQSKFKWASVIAIAVAASTSTLPIMLPAGLTSFAILYSTAIAASAVAVGCSVKANQIIKDNNLLLSQKNLQEVMQYWQVQQLSDLEEQLQDYKTSKHITQQAKTPNTDIVKQIINKSSTTLKNKVCKSYIEPVHNKSNSDHSKDIVLEKTR